jgi:hypothetical protein
MTFLTSVLSAIAALPALLKGFQSLIGWLEVQFGPDWAERLKQIQTASDAWTAAKTTSERENAAKALALAFNSHK